MRYRKLDSNDDYVFGHGASDYLVNSPATVAQAVMTALRLQLGEWDLQPSAGVPYQPDILGAHYPVYYDDIIREAILGVQGVTGIEQYNSHVDSITRQVSISATINTQYGQATI